MTEKRAIEELLKILKEYKLISVIDESWVLKTLDRGARHKTNKT